MRRAALIGNLSPLRNLHFMEGCKAHGYATEIWSETERPAEDFDFAVCSGQHPRTAIARRAFAAVGKPVVILDLGYLRRSSGAKDPEGYNQAGWNKIGWVPPDPMEGDRFSALELPLVEEHVPRERPYLLLAGQLGGDSQHGMTSKAFVQWMLNKVKEKYGSSPSCSTVYRPHPREVSAFNQLRRFPYPLQDPRKVSIDKALSRARTVLTFNSTFGVDAMLRGVPVISDPKAHYFGHAVKDPAVRLAYLQRLAYAQWSLEEFSSGEALEFLLSYRP